MSEKDNHVHVELHNHTHTHEHFDVNDAPQNEQLALLEYMLHHNEHHLEEFVDVMEQLKEQGKTDVADLLQEVINLLDDADVKLDDAITLLKGEEE